MNRDRLHHKLSYIFKDCNKQYLLRTSVAADTSQMSVTSQPIWQKGFKTLQKAIRREGKMKARICGAKLFI